MRMFLAILACKVSKCLLKLIGRGSSLPGDIALKICPDVLSRVKLPEQVIAVTGSNGKTSTVEMLAQVMRKSGKKVIEQRGLEPDSGCYCDNIIRMHIRRQGKGRCAFT